MATISNTNNFDDMKMLQKGLILEREEVTQ